MREGEGGDGRERMKERGVEERVRERWWMREGEGGGGMEERG